MATRTTCPYCGVGCGVLAHDDGRIEGDPDHPANRGKLCSKGAALGETLALPDRLLFPEVNGRRASWDAALDTVAEGFSRTLAAHGPDAVALYVSGQLLTEDYYAANKFAKAVLGTANIDSNSRLCMASAVAAHRRAFNEDIVPGIYEDLELADLVILVGSNLAWCHPVLFRRLEAAKAARPGMRVVVVDPRRTATCSLADLHLALAPGSDVALFNALRLADAGHAVPCDLPPRDVATFMAWWQETPRTVTLFSQGVNQSSAGTDKANAIINAHVATGRIATPGAGPFSVTGQPNAMGGREVGALATMLAAHLDYDVPGDRDVVSAYWGSDRVPHAPGLKAVDLFRAVGSGDVRALWIMATNPAVSMPDNNAVRAALARCPFVVVSDVTHASDTLDFAHVKLPALGWGEKDGTVTNSERVISRQRAFLPAPGAGHADWWIVAQVAARLGFAEKFAWSGPGEIFAEHARLTALGRRRAFFIAPLADADYASLPPTRWPVGGPARIAPEIQRIVPTPFRPPQGMPDETFPLRLNTGRLRDQWHTMTRTGGVARLMAHAPEPELLAHPDDAPGADGTLVRVLSAHGSAAFRLRHDATLRRGDCFAPMHFTQALAPAARVNQAVNPHADPISGQPALKHTPVRLARFAADWHALAITRTKLAADTAPWTALAPITGGWRAELAGAGTPDAAFARLRALLDGPGQWTWLRDTAERQFRAARIARDRLEAVLCLGADHALPPRDWFVTLFARDALDATERRALLAGTPGGVAPSPMVCACHGVDAATIQAGGETLEAVGRATLAGTGCGSCRPEILALLAARVPMIRIGA